MKNKSIDVLCVGMAVYDLTFAVEKQPGYDEKCFAKRLQTCGGGPAANAAVAVVRLGGSAAFTGYLGEDTFGEQHYRELVDEGVILDFIYRNSYPTPLSMIIAKPDGSRTVVAYRDEKTILPRDIINIDLAKSKPKSLLFDGHQPNISIELAKDAKKLGIPVILDAGSVSHGTQILLPFTDYLVASEMYAKEFTSTENLSSALNILSKDVTNVVITMGAEGILWKNKSDQGKIEAVKIKAIDTTGAGDTFHGVFALGVARGKGLIAILDYARVAAALCCTKLGARTGIPNRIEVEDYLKRLD